MNDPIGPGNIQRVATHGNPDFISRSMGLPDTSSIQSFQNLLKEEEPDALGATDVTKVGYNLYCIN